MNLRAASLGVWVWVWVYIHTRVAWNGVWVRDINPITQFTYFILRVNVFFREFNTIYIYIYYLLIIDS